jgi:hypothetical protein
LFIPLPIFGILGFGIVAVAPTWIIDRKQAYKFTHHFENSFGWESD